MGQYGTLSIKNIKNNTYNSAFCPDINPIIVLQPKQLQPTHHINSNEATEKLAFYSKL